MRDLHIALEVWGGLFCLIASICTSLFMGIEKEKRKTLIVLELVGAVLLFSDTFAWAYRGVTGNVGYYAVRISNFSVFFMLHMCQLIYTKYIYLFIPEQYKEKVGYRFGIVYILVIIGMVLLIISQFNKFYYYFDNNNIYHRTNYFWISQVIGIVGLFIDFITLIQYKKKIGYKKAIPMMLFILLPMISLVIQIQVYGVSLMNISIAVSLLFLFITSQLEQNEMMLEQNRKIGRMQIDMMVSQIEPHFMFNTLSTIKWLCRTKPYEAEIAIDEFSDFLRGNIEGIKSKKCIPFEKEISYVKNYIELEKKRYGERVCVEYDIQESDFEIPAFSVQVLVENAVKHGITRKDEGGIITISTDMDEQNFYVRIEDDGVGFNVNHKINDGRNHIGIENARSRLHKMCNGDLYIKSRIGKGTQVIISIPKSNT